GADAGMANARVRRPKRRSRLWLDGAEHRVLSRTATDTDRYNGDEHRRSNRHIQKRPLHADRATLSSATLWIYRTEVTKQDSLPKGTLSIAGAEAGGVAGIYADLKTFQEIGVYGTATITAIVGRHPETDKNVHPIDIEAIEAQFATAVSRISIDG